MFHHLIIISNDINYLIVIAFILRWTNKGSQSGYPIKANKCNRNALNSRKSVFSNKLDKVLCEYSQNDS